MISFVLGLLVAVVLFVVYELGKRQSKPTKKVNETPQEEEIRKMKRIHSHFQNLMNYDVEQAIEGKKVE